MASSHSKSTTSNVPPQQHSPSRNPSSSNIIRFNSSTILDFQDEIRLMQIDKKAFRRSIEIQDDAQDHKEVHLMADSNRSNQTCSEARDVEELESSIREKLFQTYLPPPSHCSIFRVPNMLRRHNEKAFPPEVVSIGPFHRENKQLQAMEIIKLRYLKCLLYRTRTTELKSLVEAIQSIEQDCRECYAEVVDLSREKFIEMMLIDGCFILEFLYRYQARDKERRGELDRYFGEISMELKEGKDDPMFKTSWMPRKIVADLLLLENQLPWCVLVCLFNLMPNSTTTEYQNSLLDDLVAIPFSTEYRIFFYGADYGQRRNILGTHKHLLDCFRNYLVGSCTIKRPGSPSASSGYQIPNISVMEFLDYGVGFSIQNGENILDVKFEDGKMKIPAIFIEENTESLFRNLIAFEHCDPSKGYEITSYASLLNCLIKSDADAIHLRKKHILRIIGLSKVDSASFLNRLLYNNDTNFHGFLYSDLSERVFDFCTSRRRYWRAILRRDYFREPSAFITFLSGVVLSLILSIIQTVFAILSYIPSKSAK